MREMKMNDVYRIGQYSVRIGNQGYFHVYQGNSLIASYDNQAGAEHAVRNLSRGYTLP